VITEAGNPTLWATLHAKWVAECRVGSQKPKWVTNGSSHYEVHELVGGDIGFMAMADESAYESSSFGGCF